MLLGERVDEFAAWLDDKYHEAKYRHMISECNKDIEFITKRFIDSQISEVSSEDSGWFEEAVRNSLDSIELEQSLAGEYNRRANYYYLSGRYKKALSDFCKAIEIAPEYSLLYNKRGNAYFKLGSYVEALYDYDKALAIDSDCYISLVNRGYTYLVLGLDHEGYNDLITAVTYCPGLPLAYDNEKLLKHLLDDSETAVSSVIMGWQPETYYENAVSYYSS